MMSVRYAVCSVRCRFGTLSVDCLVSVICRRKARDISAVFEIKTPSGRKCLMNARPHRQESIAKAEGVGLTYVTDQTDGIQRLRSGRGFRYVNSKGRSVTKSQRNRIDELVIPPAWEEVWINESPWGHIQCTGIDKAGRKQYLYHPKWLEASQEIKFGDMEDFAHSLPTIRKRYRRTFGDFKTPKEQTLGLMVAVLDCSAIRIGNAAYTERHESYGLTTLRTKHVRHSPSTKSLSIEFQGKSGVERELAIDDEKLVELIQARVSKKDQLLFRKPGNACGFSPTEVNEYLANISLRPATAKDFRTWHASAELMHQAFESFQREERVTKKTKSKFVRATAESLGNTPAVCKSSYIHPALWDRLGDGSLQEFFAADKSRSSKWMSRSERQFQRFLSQISG